MLTQGFSVYYSPLNFLEARTEGKITAIRNQDEEMIKKLLAMGLYKGSYITLEQTFPAFVIKVGQTRLAIDEEVAQSIKVRVTSP
jgi:ferrous iron transport protein A